MKANQFSRREKSFLAALKFYNDKDYKGQQNELAKKGGISGPYLSEMLAKRKICKPLKQEKLARAAAPELNFEEFIDFGNDLLQKQLHKIKPESNIENFHELTRKKHHWVVDQFQNNELATDINSDLLEIEKRNPERLKDIQLFIKGMLAGMPPAEKKTTNKASGE